MVPLKTTKMADCQTYGKLKTFHLYHKGMVADFQLRESHHWDHPDSDPSTSQPVEGHEWSGGTF